MIATLALAAVIFGAGHCVWRWHLIQTSNAMQAGIRFGKAAAHLTQDEIDDMVRSIGLDPDKLPKVHP